MKFTKERQTAKDLVGAWEARSLARNPDYQRGEAWSTAQKQAFIDSLFRQYPIPALFLEHKHAEGLFGQGTDKYEIIDGQQRILALASYYRDEFELLDSNDPKLRLPHSLRSQPTNWSGRRYKQLDSDLRERLDTSELEIYLVQDVQNTDEVRDLFIRLQSGTALTRQQIRDAWPGNMGPLIEAYAGKLSKAPKYRIFSAVDGRGTRDDDDDPKDTYVKHRQTCAQMLRILFARMNSPENFLNVRAEDLDAFYHEQTAVEQSDPTVLRIEDILSHVQRVTDLLHTQSNGRRKLPKLSLFSLALFFQDMLANPHFRFDEAAARNLASHLTGVDVPVKARSISGPQIAAYYHSWLEHLPQAGVGIRVDPKRNFDGADREAIRKRDSGLCAICHTAVDEADAEYDHHPTPHFLGGRTCPENGRLVHRRCHQRGHPDHLRETARGAHQATE